MTQSDTRFVIGQCSNLLSLAYRFFGDDDDVQTVAALVAADLNAISTEIPIGEFYRRVLLRALEICGDPENPLASSQGSA